ncbi:MAG: lamin tail domain-containing protein [Lewinellaceae bacterium]|nr:lamin tail domain-containing protein [Lewinellaceae bacterium]
MKPYFLAALFILCTLGLSAQDLSIRAERDVFIYKMNAVANTGPLVINELMASNTNTVMDENGDYEDWIELFNASNNAINLGGYYLSDNPANLPKYEIPAGVSIPANGYLVFWADEDGVDGPLHANFKLSATGEALYLLNHDLVILDSITFGAQLPDIGYARVPNGSGPFVMQSPTFGANNNLVSSQEPTETVNINLYPNPANQFVTLKIPTLRSKMPVEIYDFTGKKVYSIASPDKENNISTSQWPAGIYTVLYGKTVQYAIYRRQHGARVRYFWCTGHPSV